jgi:hypothetical protein
MSTELSRRFEERHRRVWHRLEPESSGSAGLDPPQLPGPAASAPVDLMPVSELFQRLCWSLLYLLASILKWAGFAVIGFVPMLAVGTIGIFVMVFIGAGVEMLKMAAY